MTAAPKSHAQGEAETWAVIASQGPNEQAVFAGSEKELGTA